MRGLIPLRREIDIDRVRSLATATGGRIGLVTLPSPGRPRFVLDLFYATAGSSGYPRERQARSRVAIDLAPRHPFQPPVTTLLTPVFHPHVFPSGLVCIGTQWLPSEGMDLFVHRVVRLLAFDPLLMNPQSVANPVANVWYQAARRAHPEAFPTDAAAMALATGASRASGPADRVVRRCPGCGAGLRVPAGRTGSVRCPLCAHEFTTRS